MPGEPTASVDNPWAVALLAFGILLPRLLLRSSTTGVGPPSPRSNIATVAAIFASLSLLPVAGLLGVWSWVHALPVAGAVQLLKAEPNYEYILGFPVAWLVASYFVLPLASVLAIRARYPGPLLVCGCSVGLALVGAISALAWSRPAAMLPIVAASGLSLGLASSLAFALAVRMPFKALGRVSGAA